MEKQDVTGVLILKAKSEKRKLFLKIAYFDVFMFWCRKPARFSLHSWCFFPGLPALVYGYFGAVYTVLVL